MHIITTIFFLCAKLSSPPLSSSIPSLILSYNNYIIFAASIDMLIKINIGNSIINNNNMLCDKNNINDIMI